MTTRRNRHSLPGTAVCARAAHHRPVAESLEARFLLAASLVKDIDVNQFTTTVKPLGALGKVAIYAEDDGIHGLELYRTDGTAAGTFLLKDINVVSGDSDPKVLANVGEFMFFSDFDGESTSLWKTDGTVQGTVKIGGPMPTGWRAKLGNVLLYTAFEEVAILAIWRSDGTTKGTFPLLRGDIGYGPNSLVKFGDFVYFSATDSDHGQELWRSDGTVAGTKLFADLVPGAAASNPQGFAVTNDRLYFFDSLDGAGSRLHLWRTDGRTTTIAETARQDSISQLTPIGNKLYFVEDESRTIPGPDTIWEVAAAPNSLKRLGRFRSPRIIPRFSNGDRVDRIYFQEGGGIDDTVRGIYSAHDSKLRLIKNDLADTSDYAARQIGNDLYFTQPDEGVYHSTGGSPTLLGNPPTVLTDFYPVGKVVVFASNHRIGGQMMGGLYRTDGTPGGTVSIAQFPISDTRAYFIPERVILLGDRIYFPVPEKRTGNEMWISDGTAKGTHITRDVDDVTEGSIPQDFTKGVGGTYFTASNERGTYVTGGNAGIWIRHDSTGKLEHLISGIGPFAGVTSFARLGNKEIISSAEHVWSSDGTKAGTKVIYTPRPILYALFATTVGDRVYFSAESAVWRTDGTSAGTTKVADLDILGDPISFKRTLIFAAQVDQSPLHLGLYRTDGTKETTRLLTSNIHDQFVHTTPTFTIFNGEVYYLDGALNADARSLYKTDGTASGTVLVRTGFHRYNFVAVAGGKMFVLSAGASDTSNPVDLWLSDGSTGGTKIIKHFEQSNRDENNLVAFGNQVYFPMRDAEHGSEMWTSNGVKTVLLKDIRPGKADSVHFAGPVATTDMVTDGKNLYFTASDGEHGAELWQTDGTPSGTMLAADIVPGSHGGFPQEMFVDGKTLLFSAVDSKHGRELWQFTLAG